VAVANALRLFAHFSTSNCVGKNRAIENDVVKIVVNGTIVEDIFKQIDIQNPHSIESYKNS
jgi:hypothetical protein